MAFLLVSPGPIALDLGFFQVRWYGLMTACACMAAFYFSEKVLKERSSDFNFEEFSNFVLVAIVTGLIGARTWFVLLNIDYFLENPVESFQIWLGGQSIQGAIVGAALGTWLYYKVFQQNKYSGTYTLQLACIAIVTPMGQAIGRWGNFFNEEAFGSVTAMPLGLYISHTGQYHHPTFFYEMLWNLLVFALLKKFHMKLSNKQCIGAYVALYSLGRLLIEPIRTDSLYIGSIKAATLISILGIVSGLVLFLHQHLRKIKFS
ncbi:MAG: prolipoprotein diacylglyceryl transferase [Candidatus Caenarcaniphilales bacterium]|nr:prolipoprotein diacylglyceryl transferase [Candidatus Caenarcaniphilales bacterium]